MANAKDTPFVKLQPEVLQQIKANQPELAKAKKLIADFKGLGIDTKEVEEKLDWMDRATAMLLKNFG